jgi:uncharacterized membrane protein YqjE
MSNNQSGEGFGLFSSLKNIAATLLSSGATRLELLANEIEEEKLHVVRLVLMAQGVVFCFGVGSLLSVVLFTALFWENRLLVLGLSVGLFLVLGVVFLVLFKRSTHRPERVFDASIAELQEDLRQLKVAADNELSSQ